MTCAVGNLGAVMFRSNARGGVEARCACGTVDCPGQMERDIAFLLSRLDAIAELSDEAHIEDRWLALSKIHNIAMGWEA